MLPLNRPNALLCAAIVLLVGGSDGVVSLVYGGVCMVNDVVVRLAVLDDLPVVESLDLECFPPGRFDVEPAAEGELSDGVFSGLLFVAVEVSSGDVVGFCQVRFSGEVGEVLSLGVAEELRGRGVGSVLLDAGVGKCVAEQCVRVVCMTAPSNVVMQQTLRAAGFSGKGVVSDYYGEGKDRVLFELVV